MVSIRGRSSLAPATRPAWVTALPTVAVVSIRGVWAGGTLYPSPMSRPSARDLIELVFDAASWVSWDTPPVRDPGTLHFIRTANSPF